MTQGEFRAGSTCMADEFEEGAACSSIAQALTELLAMARGTLPPSAKRRALPIHKIVLKPTAFQRRGTSEPHIAELKQAVKNGATLDPVLVIFVGAYPVIVDGHHRMAAYEAAEWTGLVPVEVFEGSLEDAVAEAVRRNSKAKLPMTKTERMDAAWALACLDPNPEGAKTDKVRDIRSTSGVSERQVWSMFRAIRVLGECEAMACLGWADAVRILQSNEVGETDQLGWEEDQLEVQAQAWADRLLATFGSKLPASPETASRAFEIHFGRKTRGLVACLAERLSEDELAQVLAEVSGEDDHDDF